MSTWSDHDVACPLCQTTFTVKVASGLQISRLPEVREAILRGELHRFDCPTCGGRVEVRQPVIYTDFARGHWIEVRPPGDLFRWPELAAACDATFHRALEAGAPVMRERRLDLRVRLVFGHEELREKLVLWDAGLDDVAVELAKLLAIRHDLSILGFDDRLLVYAVEGDRLIVERRRGELAAGTLSLPASRAALARVRGAVEPALARALAGPFVSVNRLVGRFALPAPG